MCYKNKSLRYYLFAFSLLSLIFLSLQILFLRPVQAHESLRTLRIGVYENKPKIYTNPEGQPSGIFIDILKNIAEKENWKLVFISCGWVECLREVDAGKIDIMPDVAYTKTRDINLDYNKETVLEAWSQIYANKRISIRDISDLKGRRIALLSGSIQQKNLSQMMAGFGYKVKFIGADSYEDAFADVAKGDADVVVSNNFFGDSNFRNYGLVRTPIIFNPVSLYFATKSGTHADILKAIDQDLRELKSEPGSVYYSSQSNWLVQSPRAVVPGYILWILVAIGGVLLLSFIIILVLRRIVMIRTRNLVEANENLRLSEAKFRDLFNNHLAVKIIADPGSGRIFEVNKAAEQFYGWSSSQLCSMNMQEIDVNYSQENNENYLIKSYAQARHKLSDGSLKDVEIFSSQIEINGETLRHYIIHDVTEYRRLEEQYLQAQKMESVGRLAGGVAHDYNNVLGVILGYAELASLKVSPEDPMAPYLDEILTATKRSTDITRQLLAFARKQSINPKVIDVNEVVEGMIKMLRRLIGEDIELLWRPGKHLRPLRIDPSQLEQILVNLCVNARDAISGVGKIYIETQMQSFEKDDSSDYHDFVPGDFILLSVSDDGAGMDKETQDNIFEPFFTTKDVNQGTGLGLATVYGTVKQNNGFINVYSEPGEGATFRIYLPIYSGDEVKEVKRDEMEIPSGNNETILLVEDDAAIRKMTRLMLEKLNYRVLAADSAKDALRLAGLNSDDIQLMITDVIMPEMNGHDLAVEICALYPRIKVLFMSGYTADVIAQRGMLEEDVQLIHKPFSIRILAEQVKEILQQ